MSKTHPLPSPPRQTHRLTRAALVHARTGDAAALSAALDDGVPVEASNQRGETLLHVACGHRRVDAVRVLLACGADPESRSAHGFTPLTTCVIDADRVLVELLLDWGADPDGAGPEGLTPLMLAAMLDRVELVDLLLDRGASREVALADGSTALSLAVGVGAQRTAQLLLAFATFRIATA